MPFVDTVEAVGLVEPVVVDVAVAVPVVLLGLVQMPKLDWQPTPQYADVEPLRSVSHLRHSSHFQSDTNHQPFELQQFPKKEPAQVCPFPLLPHWPFVETCEPVLHVPNDD